MIICIIALIGKSLCNHLHFYCNQASAERPRTRNDMVSAVLVHGCAVLRRPDRNITISVLVSANMMGQVNDAPPMGDFSAFYDSG